MSKRESKTQTKGARPTGPKGSTGIQGATGLKRKAGARGERGSTGPKGKAGAKGKPGATGKAAAVVGRESNVTARQRRKSAGQVQQHFDNIYRELRIQSTRMSQIQMEVDELRAKIQHLV